MNKDMRKSLETVVDAIINEDTDKATIAFHNYLRVKTKQVLAEAGEYEEDSSEDDKPSKGKNPFGKKKTSDSSDDSSDDSEHSGDDSSGDYSERDKKKLKKDTKTH